MSQNVLFLFNIIVTSPLIFLTSWLLIEGLTRLFRITHPRLQACFKLIPILKMPLAILLASWSSWAIVQHIYPWECPAGSRALRMTIGCLNSWVNLLSFPFSLKIGFYVEEGFSFSIADLLANWLGKTLLLWICVGFIVMASIKLLKVVIDLFNQHQYRKSMLEKCTPIQHKPLILEHPDLQGSPFITGIFRPKMIFPKSINLTPEEYAAVIAHELEHAKRFDPLVRALIHLIAALFWWVPMKHLIESIKEKQELACDLASMRCAPPTCLASALVKVAKQTRSGSPSLGIAFLKQKTLKKRVAALLNPPRKKKLTLLRGLSFALFTPIAILILLGKLWSL